MQDRMHDNPASRRRKLFPNLTLAALTTIAALLPGYTPTIEARTIATPRPSTIIDTPCSAKTLIEGETPDLELGNGQMTIRGYGIDGPTRSARFLMTFERGTLPNNSTALSGSNMDLDFVAIVEPASKDSQTPTLSVSYKFAADEDTKNVINNFQTIIPNSQNVDGKDEVCDFGKLEITGWAPNMFINGTQVVYSEPNL